MSVSGGDVGGKMNKRNFGRVINRIEANKNLWDQFTGPNAAAYWNEHDNHCRTPYCFLGHALVLKGGKNKLPKTGSVTLRDIQTNSSVAKWLGLSMEEMDRVYSPLNTLRDFRRWHKAGKVS